MQPKNEILSATYTDDEFLQCIIDVLDFFASVAKQRSLNKEINHRMRVVLEEIKE